MAKTYERLLSTNILREKRRDSFDPQRVILLGEDSICMVNLLEIPRRERADTRLVPLFVIRRYLAFLRPSRSNFILWCLLRG